MVDGQSHSHDCRHCEAEDQDNLHTNESSIINGALKDNGPQDNGGKETDGDAMIPMVDAGQSPSDDCHYEAEGHANFHPNESTRTNGYPQDNGPQDDIGWDEANTEATVPMVDGESPPPPLMMTPTL